jgi:hypothetical protein
VPFAAFRTDDTVRIIGKDIRLQPWEGGGGPSAVTRNCIGSASSSAASGVDGEARAIGGGVKRSVGAAVGEGGSGVARIGVDGPCSGGYSGRGVYSIGDVIGVERDDRAGRGGESWRGERRRVSSSPLFLNSSASHCLFTAFLVRFAGGGDGIGEKRGSKDSGVG